MGYESILYLQRYWGAQVISKLKSVIYLSQPFLSDALAVITAEFLVMSRGGSRTFNILASFLFHEFIGKIAVAVHGLNLKQQTGLWSFQCKIISSVLPYHFIQM